MFDSRDELQKKIRLGEDSLLELKAVFFRGGKVTGPKRDELADEMSAMANSGEGVILLGVDDKTREVLGIPLDKMDEVEGTIREICNDSVKPVLPVRLIRLFLPDSQGQERAVLKVEVPRSLFVHKGPGGYFLRIGSSKREMPPDLLARLFQQRSQTRIIRFDEQPVADTSFDDLDRPLWERFIPANDADPRLTLRKMRALADDDSGSERATVGGLLLCSPDPSRWLPGAFIQAVCYRGPVRDANYQLDAEDCRGPLDSQVMQALAFIGRNMRIGAIKDPGRREIPEYSIRACFEALVNAVAHRDYAIYGSKIRLFMFDGRLELYSPGPPPNTVSLDSLDLRQATRNELVTSLLARCPVKTRTMDLVRDYMMDKRGEGVPIILSQTESLAGKKAEYRIIDQTELLLTLPAAVPPEAGRTAEASFN